MRRLISTRSSVVIILLGFVAVVVAAVLSMHPSLSDAREELERGWSGLQPALDERFDRLAALSRAVGDARPDGPELLAAVDGTISDWKTRLSERPTPDVDAEPEAANRVESAGARLVAAVSASPRLTEQRAVVEALREYVTDDPEVERARYNDAVDRYDSARARFPGRFFADLLGFEDVRTVALPVALETVELPELPPEEPADQPADQPTADEPSGGAAAT